MSLAQPAVTIVAMEAILTISAISFCIAGFFVTAIVTAIDMTRFLVRTPELRDEADMEAYRRLVGRNMLAALVTLLFGVPALILVGVAYYMEYVDWCILSLALMVTAALSLAATVWTKALEKRLKNIPTADEAMDAERDRVVDVWHKRMLPDW
jgi:uncharacterized membrane protein